jgi:hypothetical protein
MARDDDVPHGEIDWTTASVREGRLTVDVADEDDPGDAAPGFPPETPRPSGTPRPPERQAFGASCPARSGTSKRAWPSSSTAWCSGCPSRGSEALRLVSRTQRPARMA